MLMGIQDPWVALAYILCILACLLCVVYGALNWNKGGEPAPGADDTRWAKDEEKIEEKL